MMPDNTCISCGRIIPEGRFICLHCASENDMQRFVDTPKTNGDRIRHMTDSELIPIVMHWVCHTAHAHECPESECDDCVMHWLQKEADA